MKTLSPSDRAVLLVSGVPEREHAEHIYADFYHSKMRVRALRHYRMIFGSLTVRELGGIDNRQIGS